MNDRLRVVMVLQRYYPHIGGAERQVAALAPHLQAEGIDLTVVTRRYDRHLPAFELVNSVPVYRLPTPGPKAVAAFTFTATAQWVVMRCRPHLIHAHELLSPATVAITAKRFLRVPVVAKVLNGGSLGDIAKLQQRASGQRRLVLLQRQVDRFIAISHEIDKELANVGVLPQKRIFIPNGVDVTHFHPVTQAEKERLRKQLNLPDGLLVLFTGRLTGQKRLDLLLDLWPSLRNQHPKVNLLLLGTGDEEAALKARGVLGVSFLDPVPDVAPYLQAADLFVLPSAAEGLSNALLEAMATGLPALATQVGGAGDLIEHAHNGWLIPPNRPAALHDGLTTLLADSNLRQRLGCAARSTVERHYSLTTVAHRLQKLYRQLAVL